MTQPVNVRIRNVIVVDALIPVYELTKEKNAEYFVGMKFYSKQFSNIPITVTDIENDFVIVNGDSLFYENTKLILV